MAGSCHPAQVADKAAGRVRVRAYGWRSRFSSGAKSRDATAWGVIAVAMTYRRSDDPRNVKQQCGWRDFLFRVAHMMMLGVY